MTTPLRSTYWNGFRDGLPFSLIVTPFALLFGVVATEAGLNVVETLGFSIVVIAGAAQFAAIQLLSENAPTIIILASALAINLRMAMYSASLTPHIGAAPLWKRALIAYMTVDQSYACAIAAYENNPDWTLTQKTRYFFGAVTPVIPVWYVMTYVGAVAGNAIPPAFQLDFAIPIAFLALIAPMLRSLAHVAATVIAVAIALICVNVPFNLGLIIAGLSGMIVGAQVEVWQKRAAQDG